MTRTRKFKTALDNVLSGKTGASVGDVADATERLSTVTWNIGWSETYTSLPNAIDTEWGDYGLRLKGRVFDDWHDLNDALGNTDGSVNPKIQEALGQDVSDTDIDDLNDAFKAFGPNLEVIKQSTYNDAVQKAKNAVNKAADNETVQSVNTLSSVILAVLALGGVLTAYIWGKR